MVQAIPTDTQPRVQGINPWHWSILKGVALFILLLGAVVYLTSRWTYSRGFEKLVDQGKVKLELYITYLSGVLEKYESLPELLATDRLLVATLQDPSDYQRIESKQRNRPGQFCCRPYRTYSQYALLCKGFRHKQ